MNIEQKLEYIRRALELGADIDLSFHDIREKEEAEKVAAELSGILGIEYKQLSTEDKKTNWLKIRDWDNCLDTVVFFDGYMKEDVNLDGMESEAV